MHSGSIGRSDSTAPSPSPSRSLQSTKSFGKLKFGKDKLKTASSASTSPASSQELPSITVSEDDGGEEISWHIQSASSVPRAPVGSDLLRDLVIVSTIGAYYAAALTFGPCTRLCVAPHCICKQGAGTRSQRTGILNRPCRQVPMCNKLGLMPNHSTSVGCTTMLHVWRCGFTKPAGRQHRCTGEFVQSSRCVSTYVACSAGTGSFGRVKLVRSATDGRFYALKVLRKTDLLRLKQVRAAALLNGCTLLAFRDRPCMPPYPCLGLRLGLSPARTPSLNCWRVRLRQSCACPSTGSDISCAVPQVQHVLDERKLLLEVRHPFIVTL